MTYRGISENNQTFFAAKVAENIARNTEYKVPNTKEEYWQVVEKYWDELLNIILMYAPETLFEKKFFGEKTSVVATRLMKQKDPMLLSFFNKTWASAPDDGRIHLIPRWHILCDLCSEGYLIHEEQN